MEVTVSLGFASSPSRSSGKIGEAVSSVSQLIASQLVHLISGQTSLSNYLGNKFMWSLFFWALAFLWAYGLVPCRKSEYLESPSRSKVHRVTVPHPPLFFYNKKKHKKLILGLNHPYNKTMFKFKLIRKFKNLKPA